MPPGTFTRLIVRLAIWASTVLLPAAAFAQTEAAAPTFETRADYALLMDAETDTILFQKDADKPMPPASMAKLMTVAVIFDALRSGRLHLGDTFMVSENAWRNGGAGSGGSTMFAKVGSTISVEDLIHGIIIQSANDGCITVAEGMAGTEAAFAGMMNAEAQKLDMTGSHFTNATGLPDPNQYVTAEDLAKLAKHLIYDFPEYYGIYSQTDFTWNKIHQHNRNPLLEMNIGADGLKTGYTDASGYGLVGSAMRDGQRLILIINGTKSAKERAEEARKLMDWGFSAFEKVNFFKDGAVLGSASVFNGDQWSVPVVSKGPIDVFLPRGSHDEVKGRIVYKGPIAAPVEQGQEVGTLELSIADQPVREAKVYAANDVGIGSVTQRALAGLHELLLGWW